jgi:hypothetical protein
MKKIILFILLITPLLAFGETELKPAPTENSVQNEQTRRTSSFRSVIFEPEYVIGIGAILTALVTLWHSNRSIKVAREESKRQYEIAIKTMSLPVKEAWINTFIDSFMEYESVVCPLLDPQIKTYRTDHKYEFTLSCDKLHFLLDTGNERHVELWKIMDTFREHIFEYEESSKLNKKARLIARSIVQEERRKLLE